MTKLQIEELIATQQQTQMSNPPSSKVWQDASTELHRLIELLTGKPVKDACDDVEPVLSPIEEGPLPDYLTDPDTWGW